MIEQTQERVADSAAGAAILFAGLSLFEVLQYVSLTLGIACGAFSLFFHVKRFLKERKR